MEEALTTDPILAKLNGKKQSTPDETDPILQKLNASKKKGATVEEDESVDGSIPALVEESTDASLPGPGPSKKSGAKADGIWGTIKAIWQELTSAYNTPADLAERELNPDPVLNAIRRGSTQAEQAEIISPFKGTKLTPEQITRVAELQAKTTQLPASKEYQQFNQSEGVGDALSALSKAPAKIIVEITTESLSALAQYGITRMGAGAIVGAGLGSVIPGIGTGVGAGAGVVVGMADSSLALEYSGKFMESLIEQGVDVQDANSLKAAFENDEIISKARTSAYKKGIPIAIFDLISGGVAGKIVTKPAKSLLTKIGKGAAEFGVQAGFGGGGEVAGQLVAGEKIKPSSIIAEMIGELGTTPIEVSNALLTFNRKAKPVNEVISEAKSTVTSTADVKPIKDAAATIVEKVKLDHEKDTTPTTTDTGAIQRQGDTTGLQKVDTDTQKEPSVGMDTGPQRQPEKIAPVDVGENAKTQGVKVKKPVASPAPPTEGQKIAQQYDEEVRNPSVSAEEVVIANEIGKISQQSVARFGDPNSITTGMAKTYLTKDGDGIDGVAQRASYALNPNGDGTDISPEQVWEFMKKYPGGPTTMYTPAGNPKLKALSDQYVTATGKGLNRRTARGIVEKLAPGVGIAEANQQFAGLFDDKGNLDDDRLIAEIEDDSVAAQKRYGMSDEDFEGLKQGLYERQQAEASRKDRGDSKRATGQEGVEPSQGGPLSREFRDETKDSKTAVQEITAKPLTHVPGLKMGKGLAAGTYVSTEEKNRYGKGTPAKVTIKSPFVFLNENLIIPFRNKILRDNLTKFENEDYADQNVEPFEAKSIDDLSMSGVDRLAELVRANLQAEGYDSIYLPETATQEGELIVFDKENVQIGAQQEQAPAQPPVPAGEKTTPPSKGPPVSLQDADRILRVPIPRESKTTVVTSTNIDAVTGEETITNEEAQVAVTKAKRQYKAIDTLIKCLNL